MRTTMALLFSLFACVACSPLPDAPEAPAGGPRLSASGTIIIGSIVDVTGVCIKDAVAEIVAGPGVGARITQKGDCDAWSDVPGFTFNLAPGDTPTIRASAAGHVSQERAVTATWPAVAYASFGLVKAD